MSMLNVISEVLMCAIVSVSALARQRWGGEGERRKRAGEREFVREGIGKT